MSEQRYAIEAFSERHSVSDFNNEIGDVRDYIKNEALLDMQMRVTGTFVAVDMRADEAGTVSGYFTLRACSLAINDTYFEDFYPEPITSPIAMEVPLAELMWLGSDLGYRGEGIRKLLLFDALKRTVEVADRMGLVGLHLRSVPGAIKFYEKVGFGQFDAYSSDALRYFLSVADMQDILALIL